MRRADLHYCCEKIVNGSLMNCKSFVVVENLIVYYRLYPCEQRSHDKKSVQFIDNFKSTLANNDRPFDDEYLQNMLIMIKKFYTSLNKKGEAYKTLETVTRVCFKHLDIDVNFSRGIVMADGSIIIFNDFSRSISAYLESVIKTGSLQ